MLDLATDLTGGRDLCVVCLLGIQKHLLQTARFEPVGQFNPRQHTFDRDFESVEEAGGFGHFSRERIACLGDVSFLTPLESRRPQQETTPKLASQNRQRNLRDHAFCGSVCIYRDLKGVS